MSAELYRKEFDHSIYETEKVAAMVISALIFFKNHVGDKPDWYHVSLVKLHQKRLTKIVEELLHDCGYSEEEALKLIIDKTKS